MLRPLTIIKQISPIFLVFVLLFWTPIHIFANTEYNIYLEDGADLLNSEEEILLSEFMQTLSAYGNVAFVSLAQNPDSSTDSYAESYYSSHFGSDSGILFLIDMDERMIWLETGGEIKKTIPRSYALTITDNTYSYASEGEYYLCAQTAFEQSLTLLEGRSIAQPMKYISNALLALAIALLTNYFLAMFLSRARKANDTQILSGIHKKVTVQNTKANFLHQTKRYSPQSSGTRSGGRSGGGGGSRSSGGGHRF